MKTFIRFAAALIGVAAIIHAAERFDMTVRADFFAGFAGNHEALERAMKQCEAALRENPKHAEAMVWHGSGELFLSGLAFQKGDYAGGGQLWAKGLEEMDEAVRLEPENVAVMIPRGATLLIASAGAPPDQGKALLEKGVNDYARVKELQKPYFEKLSSHAKGELLFGLADGYHRMDKKAEAKATFEELASVGKASGHEEQARQWLAGGTYTKSALSCTGCHTSK